MERPPRLICTTTKVGRRVMMSSFTMSVSQVQRMRSYIRKITKAHHDGANAVVIHCAMHTYRDAEIDDWRQMLGVTSRRHDHQSNYVVKNMMPDHAIMKDFPKEWITPKMNCTSSKKFGRVK